MDRPARVAELLAAEGLALPGASERPMPHAGLEAWHASGGAALTGWPDEPPAAPRHDVLAGAMDVAGLVGADAAAELFARGLSRRGRTSANGTCRLLRTRDGWVAVNLARESDVASVPAIVERDDVDGDDVDDAWRALESFARSRTATSVLARVHLLDVAGAALAEPSGQPLAVERIGEPSRAPIAHPRVVDLSALWAGPLCARLLRADGAHVLTVDSPERPSARDDGDEHATVDFSSNELRELLASADLVIESARPRALRQFGIDAREIVGARAGVTWIAITAYGSCSDRVGFGDDAAVAAGVVADDDRGEPVFCGDAIADPLTGMYAAAAGRAALLHGGGVRISLALRDVAAHSVAVGGPLSR